MLNIETLSSADIAQINKLLKQLTENPPEVTKDGLRMVLETGVVAIIRDEGISEIIGMATLTYNDTMMGRRGLIDDVVVDEAYRRRGLAERLVTGLIEKARELGVRKLDLTSSPKRVAANALYQKLGFVKREIGWSYKIKKRGREKC